MIFAKLKLKQQSHRILASEPENVRKFEFYAIPAIAHKLRFNPEVKLESNEWYYVELSTDQLANMIKPYLDTALSSGDLNNAAEGEYRDIVCIYRVFEDQKIIFTRITESYKVRAQKILRFRDTEQAEVYTERDSIVFDGRVDGYFDGQNKIYFKKFNRLTSIFPGFNEFHRLATEVEKRNFLDVELFKIDGLEPSMIGQNDSKKIAKILANETISLATGASDESILASARRHSELSIVITEDNRILLNNQFALKPVLKIIMGKYFTSEITGEPLEAVGTIPITERSGQ